MSDLSVAIVAGGKSSRMGTDKSFVKLLGKSLIEHILERVSNLGQDETLLITNRPEEYSHLELPMYSDVIAEKGSLGGIYSALHYSKCSYTLVTACDMPFIKPDLLRYMIGLRAEGPYDVIVPRVQGYPEGMHAIYSKACMGPIRVRLDTDQLKIISFYGEMRARYLDEPEYTPFDPAGQSFYNVNTPEELEQARRLAGEVS